MTMTGSISVMTVTNITTTKVAMLVHRLDSGSREGEQGTNIVSIGRA